MPTPQCLSYPIRLPDPVQEDALCLLDVSRKVINAAVIALWPQLDAFGTRETSYAYQGGDRLDRRKSIRMGTANGAAKPSRRVGSCARKPTANSSSRASCPCSRRA